MKNIISYDCFKTKFNQIYNSDAYEGMEKICSMLKKKYEYRYGTYYIPIAQQIEMINYDLRKETNPIIKTIITLDVTIDTTVFKNLLQSQKINIDLFLGMLNVHLISIKIGKKSKYEQEINKTLNHLNKFYNANNPKLYILKIYEIQALKQLELEKEKTK